MKVSVYDINGEVKKEIEVEDRFLTGKINKALLWEAVKMYRANMRQGTVSTKTRGEVRGGGRKPWPQKHTGRARHGSIRSPIWRKGGVVFGPKPRDFSYTMPKKKLRKALLHSIYYHWDRGSLKFLDVLNISEPRTKIFKGILDNFGIEKGKKVLFIVEDISREVLLAHRNIPGCKVILAKDVNAFHVLSGNKIFITEKGFEVLKGRLQHG